MVACRARPDLEPGDAQTVDVVRASGTDRDPPVAARQLPAGGSIRPCPECGFERLVAQSCKGRLCPSCVGRRMADIAAYLVDALLPEAPYRQWVLTFPWVLRFRLAVDRPLFTKLLGTYLRTVFAWQRRRGRGLGIRDGQAGAVTFVQRRGVGR